MLLALRLWLGKKLLGDVGSASPAGIRVSPRRWIKWCQPPEIEALEFVATNTTIPVPKVYQTHTHKGHLLVELEYVKGVPVMTAWWKLNEDQKRSLMKELGGYIRQLKSLKPPADFRISSTLGGPCRDTRVGQAPFGPFDNTEPFHACLRGQIPPDDPSFDEVVAKCHARQYKVRYTHGDLSILNILVHNRRISAIIDWECAG
ncbi:hypothetical protein PRZ48_008640 [Zasmidium cellare]|uniref:non-specific serine/threonine protein kinase n=1 Tax=Zasmidium cellare TaxID=395010 RepID=A0ABR0EGT4_ZASCE|nr:hypothetical protein PRZ48_008640 [Zasmidium cellare]